MIKLGNNDISLKLGNDTVDAVYLGNTLVYSGGTPPTPPVPPHDYSQDFLTFVAKESGTFKLSGNSASYSLDSGSTWTTLASNTSTPTVNVGDKIMWKATLTPSSSTGIGRFSSTGQFDAEGNAMSLLYGDNFIGVTDLTGKGNAFRDLFRGCTRMTSAENLSLPATTLANYCYLAMFGNCTSLTTAPELPATTLAGFCYQAMFGGCTSLTEAPVLSATTLASGCYQYMFNGCTSLTEAPELPATTLTYGCYRNMFSSCTNLNYIKCLATNINARDCTSDWVTGVSNSGTFVKAANMSSWTTGNNGIPNNWTVQDNV